MNRNNFFTSVLILIAMMLALPQLACAKESSSGGAYSVVINHEEQYSIWPAGRETPGGWKATKFTGSKADALQHIEKVWTDMHPTSERRKVALEIYQKNQRKK